MTSETDRPVLSRPLKVEEIGDGASGEIAATAAEREAIARLLDLVRLEGLTFTYRLDQGGGGRWRLRGRLNANVTQTCVLSLEPVEAGHEMSVEVEFWPASLLAELKESAEGAEGKGLLDWPEPIADGKIDLGPVIYETLATELDPYPKRAGVSFDWPESESKQAQQAESGPFAALAALKRR